MIVDDNPEKTLALQSVVEELGCDVVVAKSAEDGLRELLRRDFALALLDVHMPGMDGFELAALIRSRPAHQHMAIVFMSALDQTDDRLEDAYRLGAVDFIALPARRPVIKGKLAALLGLHERAHGRSAVGDDDSQAQAASNARIRLLLDNAGGLAIAFLDPQGIVAEWSRGAEHCTGWSSGEMMGRSFGQVFRRDGAADGLSPDFLDGARTGRRRVTEQWVVRKDGTRFWARFYLVALGGVPDAGFGVLLRDVSGEKNSEQELQIKATVLDSMGESVHVVDAELRIVYANPAASRIFGYPVAELVGMDVRRLNGYPAEEHEARVTALVAHLEHSRQWVGEWQNRRKDGSLFATHARVSVFLHQEQNYFVSVQEDLTARKQAEATQQRSAELQEIVRELEAFSYSVSHDLRSPLRSLRGFADAVIHDYGAVLEGPGLHYMQRIRHATERLEKMVEDILTVSRLPRDALPLAAVDLNAVIGSIIDDNVQFRTPHAEVLVEGELPGVLGHEPSLRQVFSNLLANAVKFVPPGRSPVVRIWAEAAGDEVTIWVADNGVGIAPEDHARIFRVFERVDSMHAFPGSGVGLAIVKRTVERLGGLVRVESHFGAGSRFGVQLKIVRVRSATASASIS